MKRLFIALGMALAMTSVAGAAPLCSSFFGQPVTTINATGCSIGALVFDDFQVVNNGGFTTVNVNVGAGVGQSGPSGINHDFAFAVNTTPGVAPEFGGDIILQYSVSGGPQIGASIAIGTANNVTITEKICTDPFGPPGPGSGTTCSVPPAQSFTQAVNQPAPPGTTVASLTFPTPLTQVYVQKDIAFGNGGSISDFINSHQAIPEPTTSLLMGTALLGLALFRKRFGQK